MDISKCEIEKKVKLHLAEKVSVDFPISMSDGELDILGQILFETKNTSESIGAATNRIFGLLRKIMASRNKITISSGIEKWISTRSPALQEKWNSLNPEDKTALRGFSNNEIRDWFYKDKFLNFRRDSQESKHDFRIQEGIPCDCIYCD